MITSDVTCHAQRHGTPVAAADGCVCPVRRYRGHTLPVAEQRKIIDGYVADRLRIRDIAAALGRSYGAVHGVLGAAGVLRPRGPERGQPLQRRSQAGGEAC